MSLIEHNISKLREIKSLLIKVQNDLYISPQGILNGATIGQHFRHILEFYICLENGIKDGVVSFDERERNVLIETDVEYAIERINKLIEFVKLIDADGLITLKANYAISSEESTLIQSSIYRELAYTLDHTIHHLAIVKIALSNDLDKLGIGENFGVAPSTVRYKNQ